jgi:EAL domain-containing protein (putative c-di-GMP-specific phosphodiesterase class I)
MTNELRLAILDVQLFLVYQPQVDIRDGHIIGVEALVRWRHPRLGVLAPDQFLPIAEDSGLIAPLGEWVLREACRQGRQWIDARVAPGRISVNLSGHQLKDPLALEKQVFDILQETGLPAHLLELEVMESALMELTPQQDEMIQRLRSAGIRLALDDFGTGNSALNYLRRFPIDQIKIAREFICELNEDSRDASIIKLILGLAREYDSDVMAEGVETAKQIHLLRGWGCTGIQGFYFSRPVSAGAMGTALLKDRKMNRPAKADFAA